MVIRPWAGVPHVKVRWVLLCLSAASAASPAPPKVSLRLRADGSGERVFVDARGRGGRERVFHGTNVVVKGPPWLPRRDGYDPKTSLVAEDFRYLRQAGINLLRLGVMWSGAEPERGRYDESYFLQVREIVEEAASHGIYVLLDMHQDVLSERFCGEGVPPWAALTPKHHYAGYPVPIWLEPAEVGADGFPSRQTCERVMAHNPFMHGWAVDQGAYAAGHAYNSLYTNVEGLTDAWGEFWAKTASAMKGLSNVLGFELINEPFAGDPFHDPLLLLPGSADKRRLQPAYDVLARHIRLVDPETLVFFAGVTWDNTHPVGFTHAPGGPEHGNSSVLSYHYYTPPQTRGTFPKYLASRRKDAKRLGTGLMMTESCCEGLHNEVIPGLAAVGQSWIHWEWKDWCREDASSLNSTSQNAAWGACKTGFGAGPFLPGAQHPDRALLGALATPYAPAVAGTLVSTSWNSTAGVFELNFQMDPAITEPTEVFINKELSFPHGFDVHVSPALLDIKYRPREHQMLLTPGRSAPPTAGLSVRLRVVRRDPPSRTDQLLVV